MFFSFFQLISFCIFQNTPDCNHLYITIIPKHFLLRKPNRNLPMRFLWCHLILFFDKRDSHWLPVRISSEALLFHISKFFDALRLFCLSINYQAHWICFLLKRLFCNLFHHFCCHFHDCDAPFFLLTSLYQKNVS